jgi:hypothetical protein
MDIEKEFKEKFCYERMDFDGRNRHHYINPTVVEKPQLIIDFINAQIKSACDKQKEECIKAWAGATSLKSMQNIPKVIRGAPYPEGVE